MKIYTDVESSDLTKTGQYLFFMELSFNHSKELNIAFENLQPRYGETFNKLNIFLHDKSAFEFNSIDDYEKYFYYILVDKRNPRFKESLDVIKNAIFFQDCYQCKDVESNFCIIRMNVISNVKVKRFINSEYSKIYPEEELLKYVQNDCVLKRYLKTISVKNEKTGRMEGKAVFKKPLQVLLKNPYYYEKLVRDLNIEDESVKIQMLNNEFDSKINLNNEIIDSKYV